MKSPAKNIGASVRARLLRLAKERGEDFQLVLLRYLNERLLFRLAASRHGPRFVLKGAALFTLWTGKAHRATRDIDLLGFGDPGEAHLREVTRAMTSTRTPPYSCPSRMGPTWREARSNVTPSS